MSLGDCLVIGAVSAANGHPKVPSKFDGFTMYFKDHDLPNQSPQISIINEQSIKRCFDLVSNLAVR